MKEIRSFEFEELNLGGLAVLSNSTREIAARYSGNNVIAKAILHLHLVASGERRPLVAENYRKAWDELARWQVDAVAELRERLRRAGTLHASAGWEAERSARLEFRPAEVAEMPGPSCRIAV